jgi:hypothetical protein
MSFQATVIEVPSMISDWYGRAQPDSPTATAAVAATREIERNFFIILLVYGQQTTGGRLLMP